MKIIKRNGVEVDFNPTKILNRIKKQGVDLKVDCDKLFLKVTQGIADKMTTSDLDDLICRTAAGMIMTHPDYSKLASNIGISRLHKEVPEDFQKVTKNLYNLGIVDESYYLKAKEYADVINEIVDYKRDYIFNYLGYGKLKAQYLLKNRETYEIYERPQHMYLRVAICISQNVEDFIETYHSLSAQEVSQATPTYLNAGKPDAQYASCNLSILGEDNRDSLIDLWGRICRSSAKAEGIGIALHNIRSKESQVGKGGGKAGGLLKYMKIVNEGLRFFNQMGERPGSAAIYLEPWHRDIEDLLEARKNTGSDELRARDIFMGLWIPDNFMNAVQNNEDWYLFCPNDIKKAGLKAFHEIYGEEYEAEYNKAVELGIGKKIRAEELWLKIIDAQIETGMPYMLYKDSVNKKSNHQNIGTIKSSNLCTEVVEYTDEEVTAICTLASLVLKNFVNLDTMTFDFEKLYRKVKLTTRNLNKVIDINAYSTKEGLKGAMEQRALGLGVQGLADTFAMLGLSFTSPEARELNRKIFETIYFASVEQSMEMAKESGTPYKYFEGSPMSKGIFQFDMWEANQVTFSGMWDWAGLKEKVMKYGVVNSLFLAPMPTASSATLTGSNECFEAFNYNMYVRKVLGGEFVVVNDYLVKDLEKEGMWNEHILNEMIQNNGSIQNIPVIEDWIKEKYKTIWEIKQRDLIDMAADRAPFIDQSQSMNLFMDTPTVPKLTSAHFHGWKKGLKTGMYYLRSESVEMKGKNLGMDLSNKPKSEGESKSTDYECFGCSA